MLLSNRYTAVFCYFQEYSLYVDAAISCFLLLTCLFRKSAIISINSASIFYLHGTKALKRIITAKHFILLFAFTVFAGIITTILFTNFNLWYFLHLLTTFWVWVQITWKKYHISRKEILLLLLCLAICICFVLSCNIVGTVINLLITLFLASWKTEINWLKYYEDMKFSYKVQAAAARKDFAAMQTIANESSVKDKYRINFSVGSFRCPLLTKSIIDTLRTPQRVWLIAIFTFCLSIFTYYVPFLSHHNIYFFAFLHGCFLILLLKQNVYYVNSLHQKSQLGLLIPYSYIKIALYYTLVPTIELIAAYTLLCLFVPLLSVKTIIVLLVLVLIDFLWMFFSLKYNNKTRIIDFLSTIFIQMLSFLYVL